MHMQVRKGGPASRILCILLLLPKFFLGSGMDNECIIGALLHDVVEDTDYTLSYIGSRFGTDVELLVDGVTKAWTDSAFNKGKRFRLKISAKCLWQ